MNKIVRALPALLLVLSGCWLQIDYGPEHQRSNPHETAITVANVNRLRQAWAVDLAGVNSPAVASSDTVYFTETVRQAVDRVKVRAVQLATGTTVWERTLFTNTGDEALTLTLTGAAATMSDADLRAGYRAVLQPLGPATCEGQEVRLDPATGAVRGTRSGIVTDVPVTAGDVVAQIETPIAGACYGPLRLAVRNAATGASWTFVPPGSPIEVWTPTIHGGRVFLAKGSTLYAFSAGGCGASTCEPLWTRNFEVPTHEGTRLLQPPVVGDDGTVFVAASPGRVGGGGLYALDPTTGAHKWYAPSSPTPGASLAYGDGSVFVVTDSVLLTYSAAGCGAPTCNAPRWRGNLDASAGTAPIVAGGVVYVGAGDGVKAFDSRGCGGTTCSPLTNIQVTMPDGSSASPGAIAISQGRLLVGTATRLAAFVPR